MMVKLWKPTAKVVNILLCSPLGTIFFQLEESDFMVKNMKRSCGKYGLLAMALSLAVAGCNKTSPPSDPQSANPAGKQRRVAAILMQDDQFFRLTEVGLKESARKNNIEFLSASSS